MEEQKGRGRPPRAGRKTVKILGVRVTQEELDMLELICEGHEVSYMRQATVEKMIEDIHQIDPSSPKHEPLHRALDAYTESMQDAQYF